MKDLFGAQGLCRSGAAEEGEQHSDRPCLREDRGPPGRRRLMCGAWNESPPCWHSERPETHNKVRSYRTIARGGQGCPKHSQWDNRELLLANFGVSQASHPCTRDSGVQTHVRLERWLTGCSFRGPKLSSQHPQPPVTLIPGDPMTSPGIKHAHGAHIYM